jgi:Uma2 family endonuclease
MSLAISPSLTLDQFLQRPEIDASPAWEYLQGEVLQKPMPGGKHSRLQLRLAAHVNASDSTYEAFPELRCTFGDRSIVPDIVVLATSQIPTDENGEISSSGIHIAPAWLIEILSPDQSQMPNQSQMKVTRNILHSLRHGGQMGWLIDPHERVVLVYQRDRLPDELSGNHQLPGLPGIELALTVTELFDWLKVTRS